MQRVITYGVLDLLSEVGGLIKIWALTIGSLSSFLLHRILNKELKEEKIKETVTFNNIKRVSDDVDDLKADSVLKQEQITDLESQIQDTRDSQQAKATLLEEDVSTQKDRITKLEKTNSLQLALNEELKQTNTAQSNRITELE